MKKIIYYVTKNEENVASSYIKSKFANSLIECINDKFYFCSKINGSKEEIEVNIVFIEFNEKLEKDLKIILEWSYSQAKEISNEPIDGFDDDSIYSGISTAINKAIYSCESVFLFVADLFHKYLMNHYLKNGNKRLSFMFLINVLRYFGYHLPWTYGMKTNYEKYKSKLIEFVEEFQNENSIPNKEKTDSDIMKISKWIESIVVIALQWRN